MAVLFEHDGMMHFMRKNAEGQMTAYCGVGESVRTTNYNFVLRGRSFNKVCGACLVEVLDQHEETKAIYDELGQRAPKSGL